MNRPQVRRDWNDFSDDERVEKNEKDCPLGVVTFLADAPLTVKDSSVPKTFCLSVLLKLDPETTPDVSIASQVLLEPEALLEPDARTIAYNRLKTELEEALLERDARTIA